MKKNFYFKGLHILLERRNNQVCCYFYNYSAQPITILHNDILFKKERDNLSEFNKTTTIYPKGEPVVFKEVTEEAFLHKDVFCFNCEVIDKDNNVLKLMDKKVSFIDSIRVTFNPSMQHSKPVIDISNSKIFKNKEKLELY